MADNLETWDKEQISRNSKQSQELKHKSTYANTNPRCRSVNEKSNIEIEKVYKQQKNKVQNFIKN